MKYYTDYVFPLKSLRWAVSQLSHQLFCCSTVYTTLKFLLICVFRSHHLGHLSGLLLLVAQRVYNARHAEQILTHPPSQQQSLPLNIPLLLSLL